METDAPAPTNDDPTAQLLVREAGPEDQDAVADLLGRGGWAVASDPAEGGSTLVLYDPADGVVRGAIVVAEVAARSFRLVAWAVETVDPTAATVRLLHAAADRARRAGGERLVVATEARTTVDSLTIAGFELVPPGPGDGGVVRLYQEL